MNTLYDILQVSPNASKEVIDMAYKALAKKYHPDLNHDNEKDAEGKMKVLNAAYEILRDEQARLNYDSQLNYNTEQHDVNSGSQYYASWEQSQNKEGTQNYKYITVDPHPWIRYFARIFDVYLSTVFIIILWLMLHPVSYNAILGTVPQYVAWIILYIIWIFIEAILLATWGTTPGKWLLTAKVLDINGNRLNFGTALKRGFRVFLYGLGLMIPLISLIAVITAYNHLKKPNIYIGRSSWDIASNSAVVVRKSSAWRVVLAIVLILATLTSFTYYTNYLSEKNQKLIEMKQSIDKEEASLLEEQNNLNELYDEYEDLESQLIQWQDEGNFYQFDLYYNEYEDMIQEYNDRLDEYDTRLEKYYENIDKYNALIGAK